MELGLVIPHTGPTATPARIREVCETAEDVGLDCLWAVDHVVLPHHTSSSYPLGRVPMEVADGAIGRQLAPNFELVATLSWVAGFTSTIGLGTSVALLSTRNPVVNARQIATLDALSGGRLVYGVGVGWLREEVEAVGEPWEGRGKRAEEHIQVLRTLWEAPGDVVAFDGSFSHIPPMHPDPRPAQRRVPILLGGHSTVALERAGRIGDGWIAGPMSPERLAACWAEVRQSAERQERGVSELRLVATVSNESDDLAATAAAYADVGVDHLQLRLVGTPTSYQEQLRRFGELRRLGSTTKADGKR